jgi:hypothetical protein
MVLSEKRKMPGNSTSTPLSDQLSEVEAQFIPYHSSFIIPKLPIFAK